MAWTTPQDFTTGEIVTAAKLNTNVRDNTRYLKGLDGDVTLDDDLVLPADPTSDSHATRRKYVTDTFLPLAGGTMTGHIAMNVAGAKIYRSVNNDELKLMGEETDVCGRVVVFGGSHASYPGEVWLDVLDTAGTGIVTAIKIPRGDTPDMGGSIRIPQSMGKLGDGFPYFKTGTYTGDGVTTGRQITTGFTCKLVLVRGMFAGGVEALFTTLEATQCVAHAMGAGTNSLDSSVHLHASDGFVVGDGDADGNRNTETYTYVAFG